MAASVRVVEPRAGRCCAGFGHQWQRLKRAFAEKDSESLRQECIRLANCETEELFNDQARCWGGCWAGGCLGAGREGLLRRFRNALLKGALCPAQHCLSGCRALTTAAGSTITLGSGICRSRSSSCACSRG